MYVSAFPHLVYLIPRADQGVQATDDTQAVDPSEINIESHFAVVDSFDMPPTHYDAVRGGFSTSKSKPSIAGQASSRAAFLRERWGIIKEIVLRNENFTPPAIGGHDRSSYLKLTSTRNLLGRAGQLFLLFGMLSRNPEGKLCLEDGEGRVVLDMEDAVSPVPTSCSVSCRIAWWQN